jgi:hypothetical protein
VRRSGFEPGAAGSLERHWHAVGMQVVREVVRPLEIPGSCLPVREKAGAEEDLQQLLVQVSERPAQQQERAEEPQWRPPVTPASALSAVAQDTPQIAARATSESRRKRRAMDMAVPVRRSEG